jgi:2-polyprenyl-6-methoxyphenol hydroxylase-like FAD-dependent oxidoreductase
MPLPLQIDTKVDPDVALTFVIVGGSIAGLATAFALQTAGHHCHVLEASTKPRGVCAQSY